MKSNKVLSNDSLKGLDDRIKALEKFQGLIRTIGIVLAFLGLSGGGVLWYGYACLKDRESMMRKDLAALQKEYQEALVNINKLKSESAALFSSALDKYDKMSESYLQLRKSVTRAAEESSLALENAGNFTSSVEQAKKAAVKAEGATEESKKILQESRVMAQKILATSTVVQESQRAIEEFVATRLKAAQNPKTEPATFEIEITGSSVTCSFVEGVSVPYSRKISGSFADTIVVVPKDSVCVVKVKGNFCDIKISKSLQGRVVVESSGSSCDVTYQ